MTEIVVIRAAHTSKNSKTSPDTLKVIDLES